MSIRRTVLSRAALTLLAFLFGLPAAHAAEALPRWEAGVGMAGLSAPRYRGSDERRGYVWPIPYFVYRGDVLRLGREGLQGQLAHGRMRFKFSVSAGLPAKSGGARAGMPDLDPTFEAGPEIEIRFGDEEHWSINLPVRAVAATDFRHVDGLGWVFSPYLKYSARIDGGWGFDASAGPIWAGEAYHDYYYQVDPVFATATRPAFDADGGYSGSRVTLTASKRYARFWIGAFARYDNLSGAAFDDSPLVRIDHSFIVGAGIGWILARSSATVRSEEP